MKPFQIKTEVTADFLAEAEEDLITAMHERLMAYRNKFISPRIRSVLLQAVVVLSLLGLVLSALLFVLDHRLFNNSFWLPGCAAFFLLALTFSAYEKKRAGTVPTLLRGYWLWLARNRASAMLSRAQTLAPFIASYDFHGDSVTYHRTQHDRSQFIWARRFIGFRLTRKNYTVLFKRKKSLYPYAIVLHAPLEEFEVYLDGLGISSLPEYGKNDAR